MTHRLASDEDLPTHDLIDPIDRTHAQSCSAVRIIRRWVDNLRFDIETWEPAPVPSDFR